MTPVDELDAQAQAALDAGNRLVARGYWRRATRIAPERLDLWRKLLDVTDERAERKRCLENIVRLGGTNYDFSHELKQIIEAEKQEAEAAAAPPPPPPEATDVPAPRLGTAIRADVSQDMRLQWDRAIAEGKTLYCIDHPKIETTLRCNSCGAPICPRCAQRTPVGFRCKACIRAQQEVFYNAEWYDYPIAALVALILSTPAAVISGMAGWWFALIISPLAGGLIGSICHWAVRRRRGRWTWLVVAAAMAFGATGALIAMPGGFVSIGIYMVMGIGAAVGVLRLGRSK